MNTQFETIGLNEKGLDNVRQARANFDFILEEMKRVMPNGRYMDRMKEKLEEACFLAVKGISQYPSNHLMIGPDFKVEEEV